MPREWGRRTFVMVCTLNLYEMTTRLTTSYLSERALALSDFVRGTTF